jgi:hypothetical protein
MPIIDVCMRVMEHIGPSDFWRSFATLLTAKQAVGREAALVLVRRTLARFDEYGFSEENVQLILQCAADDVPELRTHAHAICGVWLSRDAGWTEAVVRDVLPNSAAQVLQAARSGLAVARLPPPMRRPKKEAMDEGEDLATMFQRPPAVKPVKEQLDVSSMAAALRREGDEWEKRAAAFERLIAIGLGSAKPGDSAKPDPFLQYFSGLRNAITDCLTDARSALTKRACLGLVALAQGLGPRLDPCVGWVFAALFPRLTSGVKVIAQCAELCIVNMTRLVPGKHTKQALLDALNMKAPAVRAGAVRALLMARDHWPRALLTDVEETFARHADDNSEEVRSLIAGRDTRIPRTPLEGTRRIPLGQGRWRGRLR